MAEPLEWNNLKLADLLERIGDILELQGENVSRAPTAAPESIKHLNQTCAPSGRTMPRTCAPSAASAKPSRSSWTSCCARVRSSITTKSRRKCRWACWKYSRFRTSGPNHAGIVERPQHHEHRRTASRDRSGQGAGDEGHGRQVGGKKLAGLDMVAQDRAPPHRPGRPVCRRPARRHAAPAAKVLRRSCVCRSCRARRCDHRRLGPAGLRG